jgi:hypothetical protein
MTTALVSTNQSPGVLRSLGVGTVGGVAPVSNGPRERSFAAAPHPRSLFSIFSNRELIKGIIATFDIDPACKSADFKHGYGDVAQCEVGPTIGPYFCCPSNHLCPTMVSKHPKHARMHSTKVHRGTLPWYQLVRARTDYLRARITPCAFEKHVQQPCTAVCVPCWF